MNNVNLNFEKQILEQIPTPVMAVNKDLQIIYMNSAGCSLLEETAESLDGRYCYDVFNSSHCNTPECRMLKAIENDNSHSSRNEFVKDGQKISLEYFAAPLKDEEGIIIGGLEFMQDISKRVMDEERLREQSNTIREMSTPTIKLWEGILVLPMVGIIDSLRAQYMMNSMLNKILETSSRVIILDIHGVAAVDTAVANHLIKITKATRLMGCECLLSGISPAVAQTIVQLGIDMREIQTSSNLSDALEKAFAINKMEVTYVNDDRS